MTDLQAAATADIEGREDQLLALSHAIHADPELSWDEHRASGRVADVLREAGFRVEKGVYGLDTAVEAVFGDGDLTVAVCSEYDALPGIGHACGHNVIAAAGVGAALGLASVAEEAGLTVKLLGTPAEEHGGGKVPMLERGAWDDADFSMMVHGISPSAGMADDESHPARGMQSTAVDRFRVVFTGRTAHAAAAPERGINASNAAVLSLNAVAMLRQQLPKEVNLNAFISEGGQATNVIPDRTVAQVELRAYDLDVWRDSKQRLLKCFEGASVATGCGWEWEATEYPYAPLVHDDVLADLWDRNYEQRGRKINHDAVVGGGSTDMGNVSQVLPSIHPVITFRGVDVPPHNPDFTAAAVSEEGDRAVIDGAVTMAVTALDVAGDAALRKDFAERSARRRVAGAPVTFSA